VLLVFDEKIKINKEEMSNILIGFFEKSIIQNSILLFVNADVMCSDGSIYNLAKMIDTNDCVVATATFAVDEKEFTKYFKNNKFNNNLNFLIEISSKFFHKSILKSFKDHPDNMSWGTGIVIEKLFDDNLLVTYSVPSPFMCRVSDSDIKFFKKYSFNVFDHSWPSKLMMEQRLRVIPSSEVSFIIELQDNEGDVPSPTPKDLINFHQPPRHVTRRRMHTVLLSSFTYLLKFNK
ncbi:hypothetical protein OAO21_06730, partial [Alphaproteobacteria bacterium]|nr:hypothetical protein [Alphaproteobacteria bacterium]